MGLKHKRVVVVGGCGFIGSHLVRCLLTDPDVRVLNIDALTYAAANVSRFRTPPRRIALQKAHVKAECLGAAVQRTQHLLLPCTGGDDLAATALTAFNPDAVVDCAALTHVDRTLDLQQGVADANVTDHERLLQHVCRYLRDVTESALHERFRFLYVSTDEVYGAARTGERFSEDDRQKPGNPYSASKAAVENFVLAYANTYGLPALITRGCNTFGKWQFPEKLIPKAAALAFADRRVPLYGDGYHRREWLHVHDHVDALMFVLSNGVLGETYNVGTGISVPNMVTVEAVLNTLGKPIDQIEFVPDRPGHDRGYSLNTDKIEALGWRPAQAWAWDGRNTEAISDVVAWYAGEEGQTWLAQLQFDVSQRLGRQPCDTESC